MMNFRYFFRALVAQLLFNIHDAFGDIRGEKPDFSIRIAATSMTQLLPEKNFGEIVGEFREKQVDIIGIIGYSHEDSFSQRVAKLLGEGGYRIFIIKEDSALIASTMELRIMPGERGYYLGNIDKDDRHHISLFGGYKDELLEAQKRFKSQSSEASRRDACQVDYFAFLGDEQVFHLLTSFKNDKISSVQFMRGSVKALFVDHHLHQIKIKKNDSGRSFWNDYFWYLVVGTIWLMVSLLGFMVFRRGRIRDHVSESVFI